MCGSDPEFLIFSSLCSGFCNRPSGYHVTRSSDPILGRGSASGDLLPGGTLCCRAWRLWSRRAGNACTSLMEGSMEWKISAPHPVKKPPTFEDNSDWSFQQIERQPLSRTSASFGSTNPSQLSVTHPD